jgi:hypothetical protein
MPQHPKKKREKLPKDVRDMDTDTLTRKVFGKQGAKELRKAAHEKDLAEKKGD